MDDQIGIGKKLQQGACTAGMIKMDMGHHHVIHVFSDNPLFFQDRQQSRYGEARAGFHECSMIIFNNEVACRKTGTDVCRINGGHPIGMLHGQGVNDS